MKEQIEITLSRPVCTGWDRGFLESILGQLERGRSLSDKQMKTAHKVINRNGETAQAIHDEWEQVYNDEHKEDGLILAMYYQNTAYFSDLTRDILAGHTPDMRAYVKMSGNKYAQTVLKEARTAPRFTNGAYLLRRATFDAYKHAKFDADMTWAQQNKIVTSFIEKGGFVVGIEKYIYSAAKGAKRYKILPIGETITFTVEERFLKKARIKKS